MFGAKSIAVNMFCGLFLLTLLSIGGVKAKDEPTICSNVQVKCTCTSLEDSVFLYIQLYMIKDPVTGGMTCPSGMEPDELCSAHICPYVDVPFSSVLHDKEHTAAKLSGFNEKSGISMSSVPVNPGPAEVDRFPREAGICPWAHNLKKAAVRCVKSSYRMLCHVSCPFNASLQGPKGAIKDIFLTCNYTENVWKPHGLDVFLSDCKTYMNCKIKLVSGGRLTCHEPLYQPIYCIIMCYSYNGHEASYTHKYECLDENFEKTLPHCVALQDVDGFRKT